ncbi:MAG: hypothetical protein ABR576_12735 [Thermoanaerobaculia bacterium]
MKRHEEEQRTCANANEGCTREQSDGRRFCDTCELEWALYRRDLRRAAPSPRP